MQFTLVRLTHLMLEESLHIFLEVTESGEVEDINIVSIYLAKSQSHLILVGAPF
jgi:hypothetical protein